jgi:prepilin-type N-terminal cleavage/methylation domain-containing protein
MKRFAHCNRGFTLIEVLVALALMAMIATIMIASLGIGGHSWQRVTRTAAGEEDIAQAQEFLREQLRTTSVFERSVSDRLAPGPLISDGQSLEFSSGAPSSLGDGPWRYRVGVSTGAHALEVRAWRDRAHSADSSAVGEPSETLLPQVQSLNVQFWLKSDGIPGRWVDRWTDAASLPRLIRIDVTFAPTDHRHWPTLYIEPRIDTPATCEFDAISRRCRSGA